MFPSTRTSSSPWLQSLRNTTSFALILMLAAAGAAVADPSSVVDRYLKTYRSGDVDRLADLYTQDMIFVDISQRHEIKGQQAMRQSLTQLAGMHQSFSVEEVRRAVNGNLVVVEVVYTGTLDATAIGKPDDENVEYRVPAVLFFEVEGKHIQKQTDYLDFRTLSEVMAQVTPATAASNSGS